MHRPRASLVSVTGLAFALASLLGTEATAQGIDAWDWTLNGCVTVGPASIVLEDCGLTYAEAIVTAPDQGTLTFDLSYSLAAGGNYAPYCSIGAHDAGVFQQILLILGDPQYPWCGPPPCSTSMRGFSMHLHQGDPFAVYLDFTKSPGPTGLVMSLTNVVFTPDVGFVDAGFALDGALVATLPEQTGLGRLAGLGDLDNDGVPDLIAGRPLAHSPPPLQEAGRVEVLSGADGSPLFSFTGQASFDSLGFAVGSVGDIDGDGVDDFLHDDRLLVGGVNRPVIAVRSGASGGLIHALFAAALPSGSSKSAAGVGDLDGDGVPDVALGLPLDDTAGPDAGAVRVFSGADGSEFLTVLGPTPGQRFGASLAAAGDVDADGVGDLVVGGDPAAAYNPNAYWNKVFAVSGATGLILHDWIGDYLKDTFGEVLDGAGDMNGDGHADVVISGHHEPPGFEYVRAFSGSDGSLLFERTGKPGDQLGASLAGVGDVDGDGLDDVLVGTPGAAGYAGAALLLAGPSGDQLYQVTTLLPDSSGAGLQLGGVVAAAGDLDGDGTADLLLGASHAVLPGGDPWESGAIFEVSGAPAHNADPRLAGSGTLLGGEPVTLSVEQGPPGGSAALVVGLAELLAPFKSGVFVPTPDLIVAGLALDATGALDLVAAWPAGLPPGFELFLQAWCRSVATPAPFVATNALQIIVP